jgi:hypothetical protein
MAGAAEPEANQELVPMDRDAVRLAAAKLYGQGFDRRQISKAMLKHLTPNHKDATLDHRTRRARNKLRAWERDPAFRDLIWANSLIQADLQSGRIVNGLVQKAKRGRVDAAKLALELTGRYTPKGDATPTQVAIVFGGVARPVVSTDATVEVEAIEE